MPDPSAPLPRRPNRPLHPGRRATGPQPVVAAPDASWFQRFRAVADQFDEVAFLAALDPGERAEIRAQIQRESASLIVVLGWLVLPIFPLLLRLDALRYAAGLFDGGSLEAWSYRLIAIAHVLVGLGALPAIAIGRRRRRVPDDPAMAWQALHVGLVLVAGMIIAVLALLARGSTYGLTIAMIAGNLIYHLPHRGRWMYNTMAVTIATALTLGVDHALLGTDPSSALVDVTKLVEVIIILILTILVGSVVRRQRVRSIVVEQRLSRLALVDGLTGVASRRRAEEVLADELNVAGPARPLSLILLDLDNFKEVNDTFGHNLGDEVLRGVARLLQQRGRLSDTVGRWGGEEFVVICPDTPVTGALGLAEQLRERIARLEIVGVGRRTASLGVAEAVAGDTINTVIARADGALYAAKHAGRNRVREAGAPPGPMPS
jgi:diguanylate cyclase (GGDEF)-like protein